MALGSYAYETWHDLMTSSNANIFRVTGPLCMEFTGHFQTNDLDEVENIIALSILKKLLAHQSLTVMGLLLWILIGSTERLTINNHAIDLLYKEHSDLSARNMFQSRYALGQWETSLPCNVVSHWLGAYLDWTRPKKDYCAS